MATDRDWPIVGRSGEFRWFARSLAAGGHRAVVVAGPAGVGKTRLARECLQLAEKAGLATAGVTATRSASAVPFGALAQILPAAHHGQTGVVDDRADFLRQSAREIVEQGRGRRLALLVDDAHLLDDASATLVHQLVSTQAAFVLATVRTGEPTPDPVTALWKDDLAERLDLRGLTAAAIDELLSEVLVGQLDPGLVGHLAVRCQGNVLFLRELVIGALEDGTLSEEGGVWRLVDRLSPSERLMELVETRLGGLDPTSRSLLELLSYGEPLGFAELAAVSDPGLAETLERKGLVESHLNGQRLELRLAHPLYGDVLRERIPAVRVRSMAQALAEVVEAHGVRRREDLLRVATWRLDGGGSGADADLMLAAATTARWRYDFALAERLAGAAISAGAGFPAELLAAQLASLQGRAGEAEERMAQLTGRADSDQERAALGLSRLDNLLFSLGRSDEGLRVSQDAEASIGEPLWRDEIAARRTGLILATQGPRVALAATEPLLERAQGRALVWACFVASFAAGRLGHTAMALETSIRGYEAQIRLSGPMDWYPWFHIWIRAQAMAVSGRLAEADDLAREQYDLALHEGSPEARAFFAWHLASSVAERGHVETALREAKEAVTLFRRLGRQLFSSSVMVDLAKALALAGHPDEARSTLEALGQYPPLWTGAEPLVARAWTAVAAGDLVEGRRLLDEAATFGETIGDLAGATSALHGLARLGRGRDAADRLSRLARDMEGVLPATRAAHAEALVARDPEALLGVSTRFEEMGALLLAAEAAADAAVTWRRKGERRAATAAERQAASLAAVTEGATTPALQSTSVRAALTPAERETAALAAGGRSDREIAEVLHLSVRTIENRLQRVYDKLGIGGRKELPEALE